LVVQVVLERPGFSRPFASPSLSVFKSTTSGGEEGPKSAYPQATVGAVLVTADGRQLGAGRSDYQTEAVRACLENAGLEITPLSTWIVRWPHASELRRDLGSATLYVTLEPSAECQGTASPPLTQLLALAGIKRVVIGATDPVPERATLGASALHAAGLDVSMGVLPEECQETIANYSQLATSKLQRMARKHYKQFGRPLGFLHCSVIDSDNIEAFARHGNAFGTNFGGSVLGFRDFGSYEIAPPPEVVWADDEDMEDEGIWEVDFAEEDNMQEEAMANPMMPWYEQAGAVVATFPRSGNGPADDDSVTARLNGLKWLATHGEALPAGVERVLVMDATDLPDLPVTNEDEHLPEGVDVESFWKADGRKPTRILLRRGAHAQARVAAQAAAQAASAAADAAQTAVEAVETGDAAAAAEVALELQKLAIASTELIQKEIEAMQSLKRRLEEKGVVVEGIEGGEPIDVMRHLGKRNGLHTVVWRAGCWGDRGVKSILAGAFQWMSAHLAVDATGGRFWQLMVAENAIQAACGPERKVKVFADQEDISLEYCDAPDADTDCSMKIDGKPVRHIRLDCRVALVDPNRPREFQLLKTAKMNPKIIEEAAPWFL
jgi:pyrimidine deaminase RibD-like protein